MKEIKHYLNTCCAPILRELFEEVGFNEDEKIIFELKFLKMKSRVNIICFAHPMSHDKYNKIQNNIYKKVKSYLDYKKNN